MRKYVHETLNYRDLVAVYDKELSHGKQCPNVIYMSILECTSRIRIFGTKHSRAFLEKVSKLYRTI